MLDHALSIRIGRRSTDGTLYLCPHFNERLLILHLMAHTTIATPHILTREQAIEFRNKLSLLIEEFDSLSHAETTPTQPQCATVEDRRAVPEIVLLLSKRRSSMIGAGNRD